MSYISEVLEFVLVMKHEDGSNQMSFLICAYLICRAHRTHI